MNVITDDVVRRAFAAYFRTGGTEQPANTSAEVEHEGKRYVVLGNINGILAVYRVIPRLTGQTTTFNKDRGAFVTDASGITMALKRMKRWPKEIEVDFA
jgi:hypothetical protein